MTKAKPAGGAPNFETVRRIGLALKGVAESTSYGTPALKVGNKLVARLHQDGCSLVVRIGFEEREELMAADPAIYYITDHYRNYPWILVNLASVHPDALRDLLGGARRLAVAEKSRHGASENARQFARRSDK
jgi:hypothetical protein